jgi:hypothetical protein
MRPAIVAQGEVADTSPGEFCAAQRVSNHKAADYKEDRNP